MQSIFSWFGRIVILREGRLGVTLSNFGLMLISRMFTKKKNIRKTLDVVVVPWWEFTLNTLNCNYTVTLRRLFHY